MDMVLYALLSAKIKEQGRPSPEVIKETLEEYLVQHPIGEDEIKASVDAALAAVNEDLTQLDSRLSESIAQISKDLDTATIKELIEKIRTRSDFEESVGYITESGRIEANVSFRNTDFIEVNAGDIITYHLGGYTTIVYNLTLYDENKTRIDGFADGTNPYDRQYIVPQQVKFVRFSYGNHDSNTFEIKSENSTVVSTKDYVDETLSGKQDKLTAGYGIDINGTVISVNNSVDPQPTTDDRLDKYVLIKKPIVNGFDEVNIANDGAYLEADGSTVNNATWRVTDFIEASEGDTFSYSLTGYGTTVYLIVAFDSDKKAIDSVVGSSSLITGIYTAPAGTKYVKFCGTHRPDQNFDSNGRDVLYESIPQKFSVIGSDIKEINDSIEILKQDHETVENVSANYTMSPNLVDRTKFSDASSIGTGYYFTDYIEVDSSDIYYMTCDVLVYQYRLFDANKTSISNVTVGTKAAELRFTDNVKFVRFLYKATENDHMQFANVVTSGIYYEYGKLIPKVKENDGIFVRDSKNLNNPLLFTRTLQINENGVVVSFGVDSVVYDFIPVEAGKTYVAKNHNGSAVYDSDKNIISGNLTFPYTVKNGESYIRLSSSYIKNTVYLQEVDPRGFDVFEAYDIYRFVNERNQNPLNGKIWNAMGDSITEGSGTTMGNEYGSIISKRTGINVRNYGRSNTAIAKRTDSLTTDMCVRYVEMENDADYITVFGGTNDHGNNIPIGEWGDTSLRTVYGAMKTLCEGLLSKYAGKKIGFILPLPKVNAIAGGTEFNDYSYPEESFTKYVECIKDVCARYSIPVLDLYTGSGLTPKIPAIKNLLMPDGLHPNDAGHEMISWKIQRFLESL